MAESDSNKKIDHNILVKSSVWYTIANFLTRAMVFITTPIFTRLMTKKEYSDFSVFATWQSILIIICGLEIYVTLNRVRFDYPDKKEIDSYITSSLLLSNILTAIFLIFYLLFPNILEGAMLMDRRYILLMFAYLFTYPAFGMFQAKQRIEYKYKLSAGITFVLLILSTGLGLLLAYNIEADRLLGRIVGQYAPFIVAGLAMYVYFIIRSKKVQLKFWKYAIVMGIPLVLSYLGNQVLLYSDKVVVQHMCTSDELAWLVLATTCSHIMLILVQTLNSAWSPWFFDKLNAGEEGNIRKTFRIYVFVVMLLTAGAILIGPEIVALLGGKSYEASKYVLPAYMTCGVTTAITSQYVNIETYYKKTRYAAILTAIVAALNVALDIIGVRLWGYQAACYATVLCQIILIILHAIATRKLGAGKLIPVRDLLIFIGITMLMVPLGLLLYQRNMIRYIFVGVVLAAVIVLIIVKRKTIKEKIKNFKNS